MVQSRNNDFPAVKITIPAGEKSDSFDGDYTFINILALSGASFGDVEMSLDRGSNWVAIMAGIEYRPEERIRYFRFRNKSEVPVTIVLSYGTGVIVDKRLILTDSVLSRDYFFLHRDVAFGDGVIVSGKAGKHIFITDLILAGAFTTGGVAGDITQFNAQFGASPSKIGGRILYGETINIHMPFAQPWHDREFGVAGAPLEARFGTANNGTITVIGYYGDHQ